MPEEVYRPADLNSGQKPAKPALEHSTKGPKEPLSLTLDPGVMKRVKARAASKGCSRNAILQMAIAESLERWEKADDNG